MSTIDFSMYVAGLSAIERSERLAREGRNTKTMWLLQSAGDVVAALPPLGKRGAPVKGSEHAAMIEAIREMFPDATDKGKKQQVTRCFNLCRIVAAHPFKDGEDFGKYMDRVDRWTTVANSGTAEEIEQAITGVKRKASPPAPKDGDDKGDKGDDKGDKPKADAANLAPVMLAGRRTMRQAFEAGKIDLATWTQYRTDMAYEDALDAAAREPIQASA